MDLGRTSRIRILILAGLILLIMVFHYATGIRDSPYYGVICRFYYLPIILGGVWFCLRGGMAIALLISVAFAPHLIFRWGDMPLENINQAIEVLAFNVTGFVTGLLSSQVHYQRRRAENNLQQLQETYAKLRKQADQIIEIEDRLRLADRLAALGELSAGMAHEIRNPLGSIKGTAEILQDALKGQESYAEFGAILVKEVDRLNRVVEDFLNFARPAPSEEKYFSPTPVLQDVIHLCHQQANKNQVQIDWAEQELPDCIGEETQFKQVFLNLVLNALQAMEQGGRLQIETSVDPAGQIVLTFKDSGPGIPPELLDKVFNPFFTTKNSGTGLGLAITHRIVTNHCGHLSVVNHPAGGAQFTVQLKPADQPCEETIKDGA